MAIPSWSTKMSCLRMAGRWMPSTVNPTFSTTRREPWLPRRAFPKIRSAHVGGRLLEQRADGLDRVALPMRRRGQGVDDVDDAKVAIVEVRTRTAGGGMLLVDLRWTRPDQEKPGGFPARGCDAGHRHMVLRKEMLFLCHAGEWMRRPPSRP